MDAADICFEMAKDEASACARTCSGADKNACRVECAADQALTNAACEAGFFACLEVCAPTTSTTLP